MFIHFWGSEPERLRVSPHQRLTKLSKHNSSLIHFSSTFTKKSLIWRKDILSYITHGSCRLCMTAAFSGQAGTVQSQNVYRGICLVKQNRMHLVPWPTRSRSAKGTVKGAAQWVTFSISWCYLTKGMSALKFLNCPCRGNLNLLYKKNHFGSKMLPLPEHI